MSLLKALGDLSERCSGRLEPVWFGVDLRYPCNRPAVRSRELHRRWRLWI